MTIHAASRVKSKNRLLSYKLLSVSVLSLCLINSYCDQPHTAAKELSLCATEFSGILKVLSSVEVAMQSPVLLPGALSDLFAQVSSSGCMTKADRYGLMAALLEEELGSEEKTVIDRLLRAVYRGRLRIADELSVVI
jgi:hypothetical protein